MKQVFRISIILTSFTLFTFIIVKRQESVPVEPAGLISVPALITPTPNPYPTPNAPRQGVAPATFGVFINRLAEFGSWAYVWSAYNGTYPSTYQLVPMLVWSQNLPSPATIQSIDTKTVNYDYWLVFNECENANQCALEPQVQAQFYHDSILPLINANDPNAKLIIGGSSAHPCGLAWMTQFVESYRLLYGEDPPRAGWHFHIYPEAIPNESCSENPVVSWGPANNADIQHFTADAERVRYWWSTYGSPNDEIWITELGCLVPSWYAPWCPNSGNHTDMVDYMASVTAYLNDEGRWINRYAWYTTWDNLYDMTWLYDGPKTGANVTDLGEYYSQIQPSSHMPGFLYLQFLPVVLKSSEDSILIFPSGANLPPSAYPPPEQLGGALPYP